MITLPKTQRILYATTIAILIILLGIVRATLANESEINPTATPILIDANITPSDKSDSESGDSIVLDTIFFHCLKSEASNDSRTKIKLSTSGLPKDKTVYIVGCIASRNPKKGSQVCTTGSEQADKNLGIFIDKDTDKTHATLLQKKNNPWKVDKYKFTIKGTTAQSIYPDGKLAAELTFEPRQSERQRFFAVYKDKVNPVNIIKETWASTLQYATIGFAPAEEKNSCLSTLVDPYGTAVSAQTLEPVKDVVITLLKKNSDGSWTEKLSDDAEEIGDMIGDDIIENPITTEADGIFNFYSRPNNFYKLSLKGIANSSLLHKNFRTYYTEPYKENEEFYEGTEPYHVDIAIDAPNYRTNVEMLSSELINIGDFTLFDFKLTHPFTKIRLMQAGNLLEEHEADRWGTASFKVDNNKIKSESQLEIYLTKVDLTQDEQEPQSMLNKFLSKFTRLSVSAQESSQPALSLDPIPQMLEGYAYDLTGNAIPYAAVEIRLQMNDAIYYKTTANERGFFTVPASNTPIFSYYITITKPNDLQSINQSPVEFASLNREYLQTNNINLVAGTKQGQKVVINPVQAQEIQEQEQQQQAQLTQAASQPTTVPLDQTTQTQPKKTNTAIMVILIILIVVAIAVAVEFVKIKTAKVNLPPNFGDEPTTPTSVDPQPQDLSDEPTSAPSENYNQTPDITNQSPPSAQDIPQNTTTEDYSTPPSTET